MEQRAPAERILAEVTQGHGPSGFRRVASTIGLALLVAACGTRERLTFPTQETGDGFGPTTNILVPDRADTTVTEGDVFFVQGRTTDDDGVQTVYIELGGLDQAFSPIDGEGQDTVRFALPLSTIGHFGDTAVVRVHGVDRLGDEGPPAVRHIVIR